jgi:hypothetical protein
MAANLISLRKQAGEVGLDARQIADLLEKFGPAALAIVIELCRNGFSPATAIRVLKLLYDLFGR